MKNRIMKQQNKTYRKLRRLGQKMGHKSKVPFAPGEPVYSARNQRSCGNTSAAERQTKKFSRKGNRDARHSGYQSAKDMLNQLMTFFRLQRRW